MVGRKPGSGAGVKRKRTDQLLENKFTKRARDRRAKMSKPEADIDRAYTADRVAKSRVLKQLRKTEQYQQMTPEEQKMAEKLAEFDEQEKRLVTIIVTATN